MPRSVSSATAETELLAAGLADSEQRQQTRRAHVTTLGDRARAPKHGRRACR